MTNKNNDNRKWFIYLPMYAISLLLIVNGLTCIRGHAVIEMVVQYGISTELELWKDVIYPIAVLLLAIVFGVAAFLIQKKTMKKKYAIILSVVAIVLAIVIMKSVVLPNSCTSYGGFRCLNW